MDMALLLVYCPVALLVTDYTQALTGKAMDQLGFLQEILESNPLLYTFHHSLISYSSQRCTFLG